MSEVSFTNCLTYTGKQAAALIAGSDFQSIHLEPATEYVLGLISNDYAHAVTTLSILLDRIEELDVELVSAEILHWANDPANLLSNDMRRCLSNLDIDKRGGTLGGWYTYANNEFEAQRFSSIDLSRWLNVRHLSSVHSFEIGSKDGLENVGANRRPTSSWSVIKPQRSRTYTWPIHRLLEAACSRGDTQPSARDVLTEFQRGKNPFYEVTDEYIKYYDTHGSLKILEMKDLQRVINSMIVPVEKNPK